MQRLQQSLTENAPSPQFSFENYICDEGKISKYEITRTDSAGYLEACSYGLI
jgi:hypothetical protein